MSDFYKSVSAVTPHDTNANRFDALLVTTTGNVALESLSGVTVTLTSVSANTIIPLSTAKVLSTGTTATVKGLLARLRAGTS